MSNNELVHITGAQISNGTEYTAMTQKSKSLASLKGVA
jgi:hypothetical protein